MKWQRDDPANTGHLCNFPKISLQTILVMATTAASQIAAAITGIAAALQWAQPHYQVRVAGAE